MWRLLAVLGILIPIQSHLFSLSQLGLVHKEQVALGQMILLVTVKLDVLLMATLQTSVATLVLD